MERLIMTDDELIAELRKTDSKPVFADEQYQTRRYKPKRETPIKYTPTIKHISVRDVRVPLPILPKKVNLYYKEMTKTVSKIRNHTKKLNTRRKNDSNR
jgi:hypothetical protein